MPSAGQKNIIKVLHVDDDIDLLKITKLIIEKAKQEIKIDSLDSPLLVLDRITAEGYDCIISDYKMPPMNGIELAQEIRQISNIPFILYTGQGSEEVASSAFAVGVDDYIRKEANPGHFEVLAKRIITVVEKNRAEKRLKDSEIKYQALVEESYQGLVIVSADIIKPLFLNRALADMVGYTIEELMNFSPEQMLDIFHPDDRERFVTVFRKSIRKEEIKDSTEFRVFKKDGSIIWVLILGSVIVYNDKIAVQASITDITKSKEIEKEILKTQELFNSFMQSAPDSFYLFDSDLRLVNVNNTVLDRTHLTKNSFGKKIEEITKGATSSGRLEKYYEVMKTGIPYYTEASIQIPGLGRRHNLIRAFKLGDGLGLIITDINEIKEMEEELLRSRNLLTSFMNSTPESIYLYDADLNLVSFNKRAQDRTNLTEEDIGKNMLDFNPRLVDTERYEIYKKVLETGEPYEVVLDLTYEKLGQVTATLRAFKVEDGLGLIFSDITELKSLKTRLKTIFELGSKLNKAENLDEVFKISYEAMLKALNFDSLDIAKVEDELLVYIYGPEEGELILPLTGNGISVRAIKTKTSQLVKDVRDDPDFIKGRTETLSELAVPVILDGKSIAVLNVESTLRDAFTQEDCMLVELLAAHISSAIRRIKTVKELETLIQSRTKELLDAERLVAAGRIASMVGHDLRGPLQTIQTAVYMMKNDPNLSENMMETIENSVTRANQMLEEFRNKTRDTPLKITSSDLKSLINESANSKLYTDNIEIKLDVNNCPDNVLIDSPKIHRVLDNLISNALEAMPNGGELNILAEKSGPGINIKVKDTGMGIPEENLSQIYDTFFTTKDTGLGLGLQYCKRVIEAHKGTIQIMSKVGVGTEISVWLPENPSGHYLSKSEGIPLGDKSKILIKN